MKGFHARLRTLDASRGVPVLLGKIRPLGSVADSRRVTSVRIHQSAKGMSRAAFFCLAAIHDLPAPLGTNDVAGHLQYLLVFIEVRPVRGQRFAGPLARANDRAVRLRIFGAMY